jgi:hypothetical protein
LSKNGDGTATLEICQYEALGEVEFDEDGNELPVPEEINGEEVIGVQDGYIMGGTLACDGDRSLIYDAGEIDAAVEWLKSERFEVDNDLIAELQIAVDFDCAILAGR